MERLWRQGLFFCAEYFITANCFLILPFKWVVSSVGLEHCLDRAGVASSNLVQPTKCLYMMYEGICLIIFEISALTIPATHYLNLHVSFLTKATAKAFLPLIVVHVGHSAYFYLN